MRAEIIKIGNSRGLRIPKSLLEQCGLEGAVDLEVKDHALIITPHKEGRDGWDAHFKKMAESGDDALLDPQDASKTWDDEEWEW